MRRYGLIGGLVAAAAAVALAAAPAAPGGTITWALGSSTSSAGAVSSLLLRNG